MKNRIIILLGSPNSAEGVLSSMAEERLDLALLLYTEKDYILCTGGWGEHFNITEKPHAFYTEQYLKSKGVPESYFLEMALSANTVEDAVKVKEVVHDFKNLKLLVLTSDYHLERVKLIFGEILSDFEIEYTASKTRLEEKELHKFIQHEKSAIESIKKNGLYY